MLFVFFSSRKDEKEKGTKEKNRKKKQNKKRQNKKEQKNQNPKPTKTNQNIVIIYCYYLLSRIFFSPKFPP